MPQTCRYMFDSAREGDLDAIVVSYRMLRRISTALALEAVGRWGELPFQGGPATPTAETYFEVGGLFPWEFPHEWSSRYFITSIERASVYRIILRYSNSRRNWRVFEKTLDECMAHRERDSPNYVSLPQMLNIVAGTLDASKMPAELVIRFLDVLLSMQGDLAIDMHDGTSSFVGTILDLATARTSDTYDMYIQSAARQTLENIRGIPSAAAHAAKKGARGS